jgi:hypothetical protein
MTLKIVGAGLGRTGTLSLKRALEQLGFGPCYHMEDVLAVPQRMRSWTEASQMAAPDWDAMFEGYQACVDWPAATYWRELAAYYPDAKVILSTRDPDRWFESVQRTIFSERMREQMPPAMTEMAERTIYPMFHDSIHDRAICIDTYQQHLRSVIDHVPPSRLLLFEVAEGWDPLCRFLERDAPELPFPHANDEIELWALADRMKSSQ